MTKEPPVFLWAAQVLEWDELLAEVSEVPALLSRDWPDLPGVSELLAPP